MRRVHPVSQPSDTDYIPTVSRHHASSIAKKDTKNGLETAENFLQAFLFFFTLYSTSLSNSWWPVGI